MWLATCKHFWQATAVSITAAAEITRKDRLEAVECAVSTWILATVHVRMCQCCHVPVFAMWYATFDSQFAGLC
jgi:hypothetical protein